MNSIKCLNPWDIQSKHVFDIYGVCEALYAGECRYGGGEHYVCYAIEENKEVQMNNPLVIGIDLFNQTTTGNVSKTLNAVATDSDHIPVICIEGNVVDRVSSKNGKGWCDNVSPTLNTQDRHAICFQLCGDRDNPSVSVSDNAYCIPANPMSDRGQAVCYKK